MTQATTSATTIESSWRLYKHVSEVLLDQCGKLFSNTVKVFNKPATFRPKMARKRMTSTAKSCKTGTEVCFPDQAELQKFSYPRTNVRYEPGAKACYSKSRVGFSHPRGLALTKKPELLRKPSSRH